MNKKIAEAEHLLENENYTQDKMYQESRDARYQGADDRQNEIDNEQALGIN